MSLGKRNCLPNAYKHVQFSGADCSPLEESVARFTGFSNFGSLLMPSGCPEGSRLLLGDYFEYNPRSGKESSVIGGPEYFASAVNRHA